MFIMLQVYKTNPITKMIKSPGVLILLSLILILTQETLITQIRKRTSADVVSLSWDGLHAALYTTHQNQPNVTLQLQTRDADGQVFYHKFSKQLNFLKMPAHYDQDSLKYFNQEQIKPAFMGTEFIHTDPITNKLFTFDVSQFDETMPFKKLKRFQLDPDCCNNCIYQKNYLANKKYSHDGVLLIKNITSPLIKDITKNVRVKLKVPDAHALISLDGFDSPVIFKKLSGTYQIYNCTGHGKYQLIKQIETKAEGFHLPSLVIVNKHTILYKKCFGGELSNRARIMKYNPQTNQTSYFSKNIYRSCDIGLYLSKNRNFVGILQNTHRQSTFRLYDFTRHEIEMLKQVYVAADLKIIQATSIVSMDISEDGSRVAYIREVHQGRQYQFVVIHHDLHATDLTYPCYKNAYILEFARYCLPSILRNSTWAQYALFAAKALAFFLIGSVIWKLFRFVFNKLKGKEKIDPKEAKRQSFGKRRSEAASTEESRVGKKNN